MHLILTFCSTSGICDMNQHCDINQHMNISSESNQEAGSVAVFDLAQSLIYVPLNNIITENIATLFCQIHTLHLIRCCNQAGSG